RILRAGFIFCCFRVKRNVVILVLNVGARNYKTPRGAVTHHSSGRNAVMCRYVPLVVLLGLGVFVPQSHTQPTRSVADLIAELKKGDKEKFKAIEELEALGDKAGDAVPALIDLLHVKNEDVRLHVAMAMAKIGRPAVEPLVKAL